MIAARVRVFADLRRRFGWKRAAHATLLWVLRQIADFREAIVFRLDLATLAPAVETAIQWDYTDVHTIEQPVLDGAGLDEPTIAECGRNKDRCFAGFSEGSVCYVSMVSTVGFRVSGRAAVRFDGSGADVYVGNCFTVEQYRGQGIYPRALLALGQSLRAEGCRRLYLFVERENLPSIRSVEKAGFHPVAICRVYRWRGRVRQGWKTLDPGAERLLRV